MQKTLSRYLEEVFFVHIFISKNIYTNHDKI
ncbi:hypothetical protein lwe0521 [Listeria welshimeri serovar 6b str. SLCC5334]|uniref:Uncharacterized protein n=1 Tax=Listeria welshimeri serovar 6b (strain ATCC 35897 / DSM 20650 / CCUG 15529 / CIP 8149 / NCTC 11857 / SLCC 5334 / V8) TaxID=386043 RepID=A0AG07_LISW6|nr:hypothetical protein lwe0521 [Listeria welshimeri serovar 6b str. SLCC5334]